jgi:hypothetical protein
MPRKPTPKVVSEVCSLCGLDWSLHGANPTTETCIGLLLDEVRSLNARLAVRPISYPQPLPVIPWQPRPWPYGPRWGSASQSGLQGNLPRSSNAVPRPLNAA